MLPITYWTAVSRARRLRCPRCGKGPLFRNWILMHNECAHCNLMFQRGPGYYLGSTYINYGFIAVTLTVAYVGLHFGAEIGNEFLMPPMIAYCLLMPVLLFRHSRAWWLALDCFFDPTSFAPENDDFLAGSSASGQSSDKNRNDEQ